MKKKENKCITCGKPVCKRSEIYCSNHYQDYLVAKGQQCWSVEDE